MFSLLKGLWRRRNAAATLRRIRNRPAKHESDILFGMAVRVLVVSDDPLVRSGLAALLEDRDDVLLVEGDPDVVVWEFDDKTRGGLPRPEVPVLAVLTSAAQATEARAQGASGLLPRSANADRLAAAAVALAEGLLVADPSLAPSLFRPEADGEALVEDLTPREMEVLQLLAQGLTNKRIAERLGISDHTAKFHVNAILGKLGVASRTEAIVQAARLGLVIL
jgi:DNA-binding NarL/FixJ family response regulator